MKPAASLAEAILLRTATPRMEDAAPAITADLLENLPDWTGLIETALAHGTAGLLCDHLLAVPVGTLDADIAAAAAAYVAFLRQAYADGVAELTDLLVALADAGVRAIPFKGPTLARLVYPDPALRRFTDLDILIGEEDIAATMNLLGARGYTAQHADLQPRHLRAYWRYNGQDVLYRPDRLPVEPHWAFGQRTLATRLDMAAMRSRAGSISIGAHSVPTLTPEDSMIAVGFAGSKDEWASLRTIADAAALLRRWPELDWDAVLARASAGGVVGMVLLGVALAARLLDAPVPGDIARERSIFHFSTFRWRMRESWADRVGYAVATVCTARAQHLRAVNLPDGLGFLYPAVKLGHDYVALPLWKLTGGRHEP